MTKTQIIGQWAIDNGYTTVASIIRSRFNTSYYNTRNSAEALASGSKWIPAYQGINYTTGDRASQIDWTKTVTRTEASRLAEKDGYFKK